jgi:hypothetical protein
MSVCLCSLTDRQTDDNISSAKSLEDTTTNAQLKQKHVHLERLTVVGSRSGVRTR